MTKRPARTDRDAYERNKANAGARAQRVSAAGRDIGPLPKVADRKRRNACRRNFRKFCDLYFAAVFSLKWSDDHLKVIKKIERAVLRGDLFAFAMPRGSGKTTLCEVAAIWSLTYGHRRLVIIVGADQAIAVDNLASIKSHIERNELYAADFPEVAYPVARLERVAHRQRGQILDGAPTFITWKADEVVFPAVAKSAASSGAIRVVGITGRIRGLKFTRPDGVVVRPDLVIVDDPQTDESARSPAQSQTREAIVAGAVLGLAGPGKQIAGFMPTTVIAEDDFADRILNRDLNPEWQGERLRMVYKFPTSKLWNEYRELRDQSLRSGKGIRPATKFYEANRAAMDRGGAVAWPERYNRDEASALQHAMNLRYTDEAAFFAEYQNAPEQAKRDDTPIVVPEVIFAKASNVVRGVLPLEAEFVTAFVDVQAEALFYTVVGWAKDFTGAVVDYGVFPEQPTGYYTLKQLRRPLSKAIRGAAGREGAIFEGLNQLVARLVGRDWRREDGVEFKISRLLIDANFETSTIKTFVRRSNFGSVVMPCHGRYVGPSSMPMSEYKKRGGELVGHNWRVPPFVPSSLVRHVLYDANYWKSFIDARFLTATGDPGALSVFKGRPKDHRQFADHCTAEYKVETTGRGRTVYEWKIKPNRADNHFFDCLVGSAVAASMLGVAHISQNVAPRTQIRRRRRKRTSYV